NKYWRIDFLHTLKKYEQYSITVEVWFADALNLEPFARTIGMPPRVQLDITAELLSCYTVESQTTTVDVNNDNIYEYSEFPKPSQRLEGGVKYGPYGIT
ncbi:ribophorin I, partial [Kipferlia bialata]